jgi:hypothetical protein
MRRASPAGSALDGKSRGVNARMRGLCVEADAGVPVAASAATATVSAVAILMKPPRRTLTPLGRCLECKRRTTLGNTTYQYCTKNQCA